MASISAKIFGMDYSGVSSVYTLLKQLALQILGFVVMTTFHVSETIKHMSFDI